MNAIVLNLHILGAGFLLAVLTFAIIFLLKKPFSSDRLNNIRTVLKVGAGTLIWMVLTGAFLFSDRQQDFRSSILFWIKIGLFILDFILGVAVVNRKISAIKKDSSDKTFSTKSAVSWVVVNLILAIIIIVLSIKIAK